MAAIVKTVNALALASCKTNKGLAAASLKTINGQDASGTSFTYYGASFPGPVASACLTKASDLTGIVDGKLFILSCWVKCSDNFSEDVFIVNTSGYFKIWRNTSNIIQVAGLNSGASTILALSTGATQLDADSLWHHVLISVDLGTAGRSYIYLDGVDRTTRTTHTNDSIHFAAGDWAVGARTDASNKFYGLFSEHYFTTPAAWFDITNSTNRDKFYNSGTSKPVDLGSNGSTPTGTQPLVYLKTQPPSWETNSGSGGAWTKTGTISDGGADKP